MAPRHSEFQAVGSAAAVLAAQHIATLDLVEQTTDNAFTLNLAARYRDRVRWLARHNDTGMLGPNGIAPAIASIARSAEFHGFRDRAL
ncbi:hypothetical protein [Sphingomonas sp.]|uniref:hypothetical protein n=1 Tax=Sphingomonas sp. TaxID=28214 RepID=UPI0035C8073D